MLKTHFFWFVIAVGSVQGYLGLAFQSDCSTRISKIHSKAKLQKLWETRACKSMKEPQRCWVEKILKTTRQTWPSKFKSMKLSHNTKKSSDIWNISSYIYHCCMKCVCLNRWTKGDRNSIYTSKFRGSQSTSSWFTLKVSISIATKMEKIFWP